MWLFKEEKTIQTFSKFHTGENSDAILTPLGRVVISVVLGLKTSDNGGGILTPGKGSVRGGNWQDLSPGSRLNKPLLPDSLVSTLALTSLLATNF